MKLAVFIRFVSALALGLYFLTTGLACAADKIVLQLPWYHQFQFSGYYMAKEKGFYQDAGLAVVIRDICHTGDPVASVASGQAQFGVAGSGLIADRANGKPVVAVASIFQHSLTVFLTLKTSGIEKSADFIGKKVMLSPGFKSLELMTYLHGNGLLDKIHRIDTSYNSDSLLNGEADVFNAYLSNEPYLLREKGYEVAVIDPKVSGIDYYGDVLFTSQSYLDSHPKQLEAFRLATTKGWEYALAHVEETIVHILS